LPKTLNYEVDIMKNCEPYLRGEKAERAIQEALRVAQSSGLSSKGIKALEQRDRRTFKQELDKLPIGSIYRAWEGYAAWFAMATDQERTNDYHNCERELDNALRCSQ